jgi:hypothetical protein
LKDSGLISNAALSLSMNFNGSATSKVRIGGMPEEYLKNDVEMHWFTTVDSKSWEIPLTNVSYGNDNIVTNSKKALINPASQYIIVP